MQSALRPREIQSRIRAGQSVAEVAEAAGVPETRIEPYALPVLAEREHIAALATRSSVRRRGETMGHRNLKATVDERLTARDVDPGLVTWDSARTPDGRWAVSASVPQSGDPAETKRAAIFLFDVAGRFSIAGNDEARLVLGDMPPEGGASTLGNTRETAGEPLVDPGDELAIVRALQEPPVETAAPTAAAEPSGVVEVIEVVEVEVEVESAPPPTDETLSESAAADAGPAVPVSPELDTLYDMLEDCAEDSVRIYRGLDGEGVLGTAPVAAWEPEIVVDEPAEPGPDATPADPPSDDTSEQELAQENQVPREPERREPHTGLAADRRPAPENQAEPALMPEPKQSRQPASRKRKRASVPSWDEIMFGGPKPR